MCHNVLCGIFDLVFSCQSMFTDVIRTIRDPEKPDNLEDLNVVYEEGISVCPLSLHTFVIGIEFKPTVPHCSLATLIGG